MYSFSSKIRFSAVLMAFVLVFSGCESSTQNEVPVKQPQDLSTSNSSEDLKTDPSDEVHIQQYTSVKEHTFYQYSSVDPCQHWGSENLDRSEVELAFFDSAVKQLKFYTHLKSQERSTRELAVRDWVLSTNLVKNMSISTQSVTVSDLGQEGGHANFGIYKVFIKDHPSYFVKVAECTEASNQSILSSSGIGYPRCVAEALHKKENFSHLTIEEIESDIFHLVHVHDIAQIPQKGNDKCIFIMDSALGFPAGLQNNVEVSFQVGKQAARLHLLSWSHEDMHGLNTFYDSKMKRTTYIDLASFKNHGDASLTVDVGIQDILVLATIQGPNAKQYLQSYTLLFRRKLKEILKTQDVQSQEDYSLLFRKLFNSKQVQNLEEFKDLQEKSKMQEAFFKGYISQLSASDSLLFQEKWSELCQKILKEQILQQENFQVPQDVQHEFLSLLPEVVNCSNGKF